MVSHYKTVYQGGEAEITEKKSRFIATVHPIKTEEEALQFIESMRKKYWNASHNCFAYVLGEQQELQRCSDAGEPGGTAGKPMLDVLLGEEIHNTAIVVTRYFGGTLLGTGGLVRAYQGAAKAGLESSVIIDKKRGKRISIETSYTGLGKIQYVLRQRGLSPVNILYTDKAVLEILVPSEEEKTVTDEITEGTNGQAVIIPGEECYFAEVFGEIEIYEGDFR